VQPLVVIVLVPAVVVAEFFIAPTPQWLFAGAAAAAFGLGDHVFFAARIAAAWGGFQVFSTAFFRE
jgi:hypothetical protein